MDEEERRARAVEGLDVMYNCFVGPRLASEMLEDSQREKNGDGNYSVCNHLTLPEIWKEIASVMK